MRDQGTADDQPGDQWETLGDPTAIGGRWVTIAEAAEALGVSADTVRRRMRRGDIPAREEPRPQGFRWLVLLDVDQVTPSDSGGRTMSADHGRGVSISDTSPATSSSTSSPGPSTEVIEAREELIHELRGEVDDLRRRLDARDREAGVNAATIARLTAAIDDLSRRQLVAPTSPVTGADVVQGSGAQVPADRPSPVTTGTAAAQVDRPSWWRRLFGG